MWQRVVHATYLHESFNESFIVVNPPPPPPSPIVGLLSFFSPLLFIIIHLWITHIYLMRPADGDFIHVRKWNDSIQVTWRDVPAAEIFGLDHSSDSLNLMNVVDERFDRI